MNGTPARRPKSAFSETGVRIKEVSEGRPCDNCPELCPGFIPHAWRKTCKSCGCDRLKHSVYHEELSSVRDRLGLRDSPPALQSIDTLPGLNAKETDIFWQSLAERAPVGIGGATGPAAWRAWRNRALASQLPKQDLSLAHCRHVDEIHHKQYEDFVAARNEIALDIGIGRQVFGKSLECMGCNKAIRNGNIAIEAPRLGEQAYFHPGCFSCAECEEPLVEFAYCALDGRLYCVRHYAERLKPRCHACDELFKSSPGAVSPHPPCSPKTLRVQNTPFPFLFINECLFATGEMGIVLSAVISYAGINEALECIRHLVGGVIPSDHPGFDDLVEYYRRELQKSTKQANDWTTECGQGYLSLKEDENGKLSAAAIKYYSAQPDSTAILFSTKISSFGDSIEEPPVVNGDYRSERYSPSKTKTIVLNTTPETYSVANRNKSPGADTQTPAYSFDQREPEENQDKEDKLTWQYTPLNSNPEIHFQSYDDDKPGFFTEDYLRSLDGIKYRPLQRSDPSGRRRSFRKRHSSSSNSSKESRASRDEELQMFTSLEEAEFSAAQASSPETEGFGSAPNLSAHSFRSRSRERRNENWSVEASDNSIADDAKVKETPDSVDEQTKDDELIFSGEYTKAMNKDWHSGHFCCWQCDESLTGQRYVLRDEHPYCIKCYESVFANGCEECNKTIGIDSKDLSYKDKHWHEACFLCAKCRVSLVDKQFGSKLDKIYCGNCYDAQFASRCDGCGEVFRAGTKKMEYKTRQWHEKCFCCVVCKNPIGTKSFIPREQEIYCAGCYEDKFATRCVKCNKIITQGGVTYKNEPWHRECFTCTNCNTSLAGQRFTSRDEKPYCAECFGELFAKRCTACTKPITGIGGTRFISFEDRHWHNDCFICAQCKTSLVGKGFITDAQDIICPECAKQKLM